MWHNWHSHTQLPFCVIRTTHTHSCVFVLHVHHVHWSHFLKLSIHAMSHVHAFLSPSCTHTSVTTYLILHCLFFIVLSCTLCLLSLSLFITSYPFYYFYPQPHFIVLPCLPFLALTSTHTLTHIFKTCFINAKNLLTITHEKLHIINSCGPTGTHTHSFPFCVIPSSLQQHYYAHNHIFIHVCLPWMYGRCTDITFLKLSFQVLSLSILSSPPHKLTFSPYPLITVSITVRVRSLTSIGIRLG